MDLLTIAVTTTGTAGSASGNESSIRCTGRVYAVYLAYHASAPATTDVTLAMAGTPSESILTIANNATSGWYYPRRPVCLNDGTALAYDIGGSQKVCEPYAVVDRLKLSVAQSDALTDCVVAYVYLLS